MGREQQRQVTRERLLSAAIELFSRNWISQVSVADICRTAGMSNGVYYRYFSSREEIFLEILNRYHYMLVEALDSVTGATTEQRLADLCRVVFRLSEEQREITQIFRQGQYRYYDYEVKINQLYEQHLTRTLGRAPTAGELIYVMAGIRFSAFRRTYHDVAIEPEQVLDVILRGVFQPDELDWDRVFGIDVRPLPLKLQESTPEKLVNSGKDILGKTGFHGMNIYRLTSAIGLGVGTFYNYFEGKEQFTVRIIETISHQIRQFISSNLRSDLSRLEKELQGMVLFAFYISNVDPSCYNIVREAEFVTPAAVRRYYDDFAKGYAKAANGLRIESPWFAGTVLMGLSHYFGLAVLHDPTGYQEASRKTLKDISNLLTGGLR
ncbi:MAG: TetR/AcrR family transcriptional regulator [Spirochaetaceae bacterium]|nr:MAG: TetR/AcrR family transcriptional regulator [Spirochaetaceae bacterium]